MLLIFLQFQLTQEVIEKLENLTSLVREDASENGLLRSRIEQQCELFHILIKRVDESLKTSAILEDEIDVLERKYSDLKKDHQELLKVTDEYKTENKKLHAEINLIRNENELKINQLKDELKSVQLKYQEQER